MIVAHTTSGGAAYSFNQWLVPQSEQDVAAARAALGETAFAAAWAAGRAATLEEAVRTADALARDALAGALPSAGPATVLLSPAAASFDMFTDYAARGTAFKRAVATLAEDHRTGRDR